MLNTALRHAHPLTRTHRDSCDTLAACPDASAVGQAPTLEAATLEVETFQKETVEAEIGTASVEVAINETASDEAARYQAVIHQTATHAASHAASLLLQQQYMPIHRCCNSVRLHQHACTHM